MAKSNNTVAAAVAVVVIVIVAIVLFMVFNDSDTEDDAVNNNTNNSAAIEENDKEEDTLEQITENPDNYIGQNVTVTGEVQDVLSDRAFKISGETVGDELLVFASVDLTQEQLDQAEAFLQDNANVRVNGTITRATVVEFEEEYGIEFGTELEAEFEKQIVLVADSITFIDQGGAIWEFNNETEGTRQQ